MIGYIVAALVSFGFPYSSGVTVAAILCHATACPAVVCPYGCSRSHIRNFDTPGFDRTYDLTCFADTPDSECSVSFA